MTGLKEKLLSSFEVLPASARKMPLRKEALHSFRRLDFPGSKDEAWKYSGTRQLEGMAFSNTGVMEVPAEEAVPFFIPELKGTRLVYVNGVLNKNLSHVPIQREGVFMSSFSEVPDRLSERFRFHYGRYAKHESEFFTAMSTAFSADGIFIYIPAGAILYKEPVHICHISDNRKGASVSQPRNLIVLEDYSQLSLIESYHVLGQEIGFTNAVTEIYAGNHSYMDYCKYQADCGTGFHIGTTQVLQEAGSHFSSSTVTWSGRFTRNNLCSRHAGTHCETHYSGLSYATGSDHIDNHTVVEHAMPDCTSTELYKGLADDEAVLVFNGKIKVFQDAQHTDAIQSSKNILLSERASVNAKPELEIFANDVRCTHGATTGMLSGEEFFYLRSRGIGAAKARSLLIRGFARDVLEKIRIIPLNKHLDEMFALKVYGRRI